MNREHTEKKAEIHPKGKREDSGLQAFSLQESQKGE